MKQLDLAALARWLFALSSDHIETSVSFRTDSMQIGFRDRRAPRFHGQWSVNLNHELKAVRVRLAEVRKQMTKEIARRA